MFNNGDRVHVEFDGVYGGKASDSCWVEITDSYGFIHQFWPSGLSSVATKAKPANWPPRPGDVWEAEGTLYGIQRSTMIPGQYVAREIESGNMKFVPRGHAGNSHAAFLALNPSLVKRQDA